MSIYYSIAIAFTLIGSIFGLLSYLSNEILIDKALANRKYIRTLIILFLHGPFVWLLLVFKGARIMWVLGQLMIMYVLQELPEEPEEAPLPDIRSVEIKPEAKPEEPTK